jgi:hypothetical protein
MGKVKKNVGKRQRELTLRKSTNEKKKNTPLKTMRFCGGNKNRNFRTGKEIVTCQLLVYSNVSDSVHPPPFKQSPSALSLAIFPGIALYSEL